MLMNKKFCFYGEFPLQSLDDKNDGNADEVEGNDVDDDAIEEDDNV